MPVLHSVENETLFLSAASTTFHGRDRFAPVAAALTNGTPFSQLGPSIADPVTLRYEPPRYGEEVVHGTTVAVDRFGNVITDIERARIRAPFALHVRGTVIDRLEEAYGNAAPGPFLIVGSSGFLEISIANASAAERLQLRRLERVELWQSGNAVADV